MKDLPRVFANPINKKINNNSTLSYGVLKDERKVRDDVSVRDKIDKIFKSTDKIYSIDCIVTYENHEEKYTIIGKTDNNLVTNHQRLIPIRDIYDIELA